MVLLQEPLQNQLRRLLRLLVQKLIASFDVLLLGSSTWGIGDLQDDWESFLPELASQNLSGKAVALFGCGDSDSYPDSFCEALAKIKEGLAGTGCKFVGAYAPEEYTYDATASEEDGKLIGLCVDDVNQSDLTDARLATWLEAFAGERQLYSRTVNKQIK